MMWLTCVLFAICIYKLLIRGIFVKQNFTYSKLVYFAFFFRNKKKKYVGYQVQDKNEYKNIWDRKINKYNYKYSWFDIQKGEYKYT